MLVFVTKIKRKKKGIERNVMASKFSSNDMTHVEMVPPLAGERRLAASAILYVGMRCGLGVFLLDVIFVFVGVSLASVVLDSGCDVFGASLVRAECVGVFSRSVDIVVVLRCWGVGVSGVDGGLALDAADGVLVLSSMVHFS